MLRRGPAGFPHAVSVPTKPADPRQIPEVLLEIQNIVDE